MYRGYAGLIDCHILFCQRGNPFVCLGHFDASSCPNNGNKMSFDDALAYCSNQNARLCKYGKLNNEKQSVLLYANKWLSASFLLCSKSHQSKRQSNQDVIIGKSLSA